MGMTALCLPCGAVAQPRNALVLVFVRLVLGRVLVGFLGRLLALVVLVQRLADAVKVGLVSLLHAGNLAAVIFVPSCGAMACGVAIAEQPAPVAPLRRRVARAAVVLLAVCAAGGASLYATLPGVDDAARRVAAGLRDHGGAPTAVLPRRIATAVVAVEDERYWSHGAVDLRAIARAAVEGIAHPGRDSGGSTIAQQLAKVLYLHGADGPVATLKAVGLAFKLEHRWPKARLLAFYLDSVYFGHGHWGVAAASRGYFATKPARLSWGQASLLAGLPQAPSADDPVTHFAAARARQREVLHQLVANHDLTAAQAAQAYANTPRPFSSP
jgi:monofunctional glycosyltransferase